jgi:hypothetical protein
LSFRRWILVAIYLGLPRFLPGIAHAQSPPTAAKEGIAEPTNAEQVIARYKEAIGAERYASIKTFEERGELSGNLTNFWQGSGSPRQSQMKERGMFEIYYKAPNLKFGSTVNDKNQVIALHGCDGKVSWYIDAYMRRTEFKPKPGNEYECRAGFEQMLSFQDERNTRVRLTKKKEVEGRMAWEVKVEFPRSGTEIFYFDAQTYLLLRSGGVGYSITYSDYRDVGGIKFPFEMVNDATNSKLVTTVRELKINSPIEDARFVEPAVKGNKVEYGTQISGTERREAGAPSEVGNGPLKPKDGLNAAPSGLNAAQSGSVGDSGSAESPASTVSSAEHREAGAPSAVGNSPLKPNDGLNGAPLGVSEVNFPNFTLCSIEELQLAVPELAGLKPARDQEKLAALLEKVGDKTVDEARHTPDLISVETVVESQQGTGETRRDYDYLILRRVEGNVVGLNEFRVDRKTGDQFQTVEAMKNDPGLADLERASQNLASSSGRPPISQGFATSWVHFYPANRGQASFRYLGEQKMSGQRTLVLAFAQKPGSVLTPALFRSKDKMVPMFLQGVAWVSASDFRIVHLRTDLLSPLPEVSLHRLTTETQFVAIKIQGVDSVLWLPRDVLVTAEVQGTAMREDHRYSDYRLFRAKSRVVLN